LAALHPKLAKEWHPTKNGDLTPAMVKCGSNKSVWWVCARGHEWQTDVFKRTHGADCPFCRGRKVLAGFNDLAAIRPELTVEWDYARNTVQPTEVTVGTSRKAWWICRVCAFSWQARVSSRALGHGCPNCAGRAVVKGQNDLRSRSAETIRFWDFAKNGELSPGDFAAGSRKVVWWRDKRCGHEWERSVAAQTTSGICPICAKRRKTSFPEKAIAFYLGRAAKADGTEIQENYIFCEHPKRELDIFIPHLRAGIEYDGVPWHEPGRDTEKNRLCAERGIRLIRIREHGLPYLDDGLSENYTIDSRDGRDLVKAIRYIFHTLGLGSVDVDFDRDREAIQRHMRNLD
jgi:rubrerythrin